MAELHLGGRSVEQRDSETLLSPSITLATCIGMTHSEGEVPARVLRSGR